MNDTTEKRRLASILSADAVGYSRLMGSDEEWTIRTLTRCRALFARSLADPVRVYRVAPPRAHCMAGCSRVGGIRKLSMNWW